VRENIWTFAHCDCKKECPLVTKILAHSPKKELCMALLSRPVLLSISVIIMGVATATFAHQNIRQRRGTQADPIQITTCQQLQDISNNLSADYVLTHNIDCSDTKNWNNGAGFMPINNFSGTFDGQMHHVLNLMINRPDNSMVGVFASSIGTIQKVSFDNENIHGLAVRAPVQPAKSYMGGIVALNEGLLTQTSAQGNYYSNAIWSGVAVGENMGKVYTDQGHGQIQGNSNIGGLIGYQYKTGDTVNCYSDATVKGIPLSGASIDSIDAGGIAATNDGRLVASYATGDIQDYGIGTGGLVGWNQENANLSDSYATGSITGLTAGGVVGYNNGRVVHVYAIGAVIGSQKHSGIIGTLAQGTVQGNYYNKDTTGQADTNRGGIPVTTQQMFQQSTFTGWDFTNNWTIDEGKSYPQLAWVKPTPISTCQELQDINKSPKANYILDNDIQCADSRTWNAGAGFMPINNFSGQLDGQHHTVYNLTIDQPTSANIGVFAVSTGSIYDINFSDEHIQGLTTAGSALTYMGGVVAYNTGSLSNVSAEGDYNGNATSVGVLVGQNDGQINGCSGHGNIQGTTQVAGLVGYLHTTGTIINSYSDATVANGSIAGGLVSSNNGHIQSSYATGDILAGNYVGGLVGYQGLGSTINSYASGAVNGNHVGGLTGFTGSKSSIINAYATGHVITTGSDIGGLVGFLESGATINNAYYDTDTSGQSDTGKGTPIHTKQMFNQATFNNWDFSNAWTIAEGHDFPKLAWQTVPFIIRVLPITSPQTIAKPFPVSIIASNANYNGQVQLSSERGDTDPTYVTLTNGQWTGNVSLNTVGTRNQLLLRWDAQSENDPGQNVSQAFDVNDESGAITNDAQLTGIVTDSNSQPLANVTVQLYAHSPISDPNQTILYTATTDNAGAYNIASAVPGEYYVSFTLAGYQKFIQETQLAEARMVNLDSVLASNCASGKVPVLLVPGIMGSTIPGLGRIYPRLPYLSPSWNNNTLELLDPFNGFEWSTTVGWKMLEDKLKTQGYQSNCTMFVVPYDWTLPITKIRDDYLMPWIKEAEKRTGKNQVDIIAHSMGGLVARSYMQSSNYAKDIRKFAMVGTPNEGATMPYYIWEGGNPRLADTYADNTSGLGKYFYSNTLSYLMRDRAMKMACGFDEDDNALPLWCNNRLIYSYLNTNKQGLSVGELMPIYDDALQDASGTNMPIIFGENSVIKALDSVPCHTSDTLCRDSNNQPYYFLPPSSVFTADSTGVQTKLFYGGLTSTTPQSIPIKDKGNPLYQDGQPSAGPSKNSGDGTVLNTSIKSQYLPANLPTTNLAAMHAGLIKAGVSSIVSFITNKTISASYYTPAATPVLDVLIEGHIQPTLTGVDTYKKAMVWKAAQEKDDDTLDHSGVELTSPAAGQYTATFKAASAGEYSVTIRYIDPSNDQLYFSRRFSDTISNNETQSFSFDFDPTKTEVITLGRALLPPSRPTVQNNNDNIELVWTDPTGETNKDVDHYAIYVKQDNSPVFNLLANTTDKDFTTSQPWANVANISYVVQAVLKDKTNTVFSSPSFYDDNTCKGRGEICGPT
jgi:pimeloyl-ACP methyl ester carboxylesterase